MLIVGCGYVGSEVVKLACEQSVRVFALTRSESRVAELSKLGIEPIVGHWLDSSNLKSLPAVDRVLVSVPHRADGQFGVETHVRGLQNLLVALPSPCQHVTYLSTTGVFGSGSGELVDEDTPVSPTRIGPEIAIQTEQWLSDSLPSERFTVLRLAGIYGPGRIPLAEKLRLGEPLTVPRHGHLNLIHVHDIANMILTIQQRAMRHSMYLLSDGQPVLRETFYRYLARLCGVSQPQFAPVDENSPKSRRATDKRIDPSRLLVETAFSLRFADYRSGLVDAIG